MTPDLSMLTECAVKYGPLLALAVAILKRMGPVGAWIQRNPKLVAFVLASALGAVQAGVAGHLPASTTEWLAFAQCVTASYTGAVATHETVLDPISKATGIAAPKPEG